MGAGGGLRGKGERVIEGETELCAGHEGGGGEDEKRGVCLLESALEPIPRGGGDAAEFAEGGAAQIEQEEIEVGIAGKKVGDGHGFELGAAAKPNEAMKIVGGPGCGIEAIRAIDERDAAGLGASGVKDLPEEKLATATGRVADEFG